MSDQILTRMRNWITNCGLTDGARLPPERTLCAELGVNRTELRKALLVLEAEGHVTRHVGRGTFLSKAPKSNKGGRIDDTIVALAESTSPFEAMNARLVVEPQIARLAAMHATPKHLQELRRLTAQMRDASTWARYEELDGAFHEMIADAAGNTLLQAVHKIINRVRLVVVWRKIDTTAPGPTAGYHSFAEHDAIVDALERRKGGDAAAAMQAHLDSTLAAMTAPHHDSDV
ncbi:DNA-binding FadR family transcriptional regulator [Loktanella ponticola]|uniref:DNA-binding FadR family transcriptional regulator n=1 Tax=Yoonia ponticola TaxID=1524255 RepID=A0A7W9EWK6_9RHOB|nr:FCD domain-containing protein [Yoonia ponticola]MBB5720802.1 DNA-binding FadR family transcriptional regulator [Yoonia ponticola]